MPINHYLNRYRYLYRGRTVAGCCKASCASAGSRRAAKDTKFCLNGNIFGVLFYVLRANVLNYCALCCFAIFQFYSSNSIPMRR